MATSTSHNEASAPVRPHGNRSRSSSGGTRPGGGQGVTPGESGDDPSLKPFPSQGGDRRRDAGVGESLAKGMNQAGSRSIGLAPGAVLGGAGGNQQGVVLPDLEPAAAGRVVLLREEILRRLSTAVAGAIGQNGLPMLDGPGGSVAGTPGGGPSAPSGTGTDLAAAAAMNSQQPPATGGVPPSSTTNSQVSVLKPDTNSVPTPARATSLRTAVAGREAVLEHLAIRRREPV